MSHVPMIRHACSSSFLHHEIVFNIFPRPEPQAIVPDPGLQSAVFGCTAAKSASSQATFKSSNRQLNNCLLTNIPPSFHVEFMSVLRASTVASGSDQ